MDQISGEEKKQETKMVEQTEMLTFLQTFAGKIIEDSICWNGNRRIVQRRFGNSMTERENGDQKLIKQITISCWNVISQLETEINEFHCAAILFWARKMNGALEHDVSREEVNRL